MCDPEYALQEKVILGILKPIYSESEIEEWLEYQEKDQPNLEQLPS